MMMTLQLKLLNCQFIEFDHSVLYKLDGPIPFKFISLPHIWGRFLSSHGAFGYERQSPSSTISCRKLIFQFADNG